MDKSNFDIIKCPDGCGNFHIMLTSAWATKEQANDEIEAIIDGTSFYSMGNKQIKRLQMIKLHQDACDEADSKRPNPT